MQMQADTTNIREDRLNPNMRGLILNLRRNANLALKNGDILEAINLTEEATKAEIAELGNTVGRLRQSAKVLGRE